MTIDRTLIFLVDGRQIIAPSADWHGSVIGAESLLEQMTIIIPTAQFLRIIQGHHVEGQIAFTTFDLTDENLEALLSSILSGSGWPTRFSGVGCCPSDRSCCTVESPLTLGCQCPGTSCGSN
jgi:hypothetical protein